MIVEAATTATINTDTLPCGIVCINDDGKIISVNSYICSLLGYSKNELEEAQVEMMLTLSARIFYQTHFYPLVKLHNKAEEVFFSLRSKDGDHVPVIGYANRSGDYICCVFVPVRQRRKYEEEILQAKKVAEDAVEKNDALIALKDQAELQLAESERQLSLLRRFNQEYVELNRIISHDLHEPIRKLMVHIDILLADKGSNQEKLEASLRKMMQFCNRLRHLTISLQQYVAVDLITEPLTTIDLKTIVEKVFDVVANEERYPEAVIDIDEMPEIEGYHSQLERLFSEIISNSFKFRREDLPLKITVSSTEFSNNIYKERKDKYRYISFVRIDVEDNGSGFPAEYDQYIFELFKRIRLDKEGAGFGLALCKKIVERHKGSISAKSSNGKTIFSILLPVKQSSF